MTFQLREIVLYNRHGDVRTVPFKLNSVNILVGASKAGKSALIRIIDYVLGSSEFKVPGIIRKGVLWYGLRLWWSHQEIFVARRAPKEGFNTSTEYVLLVGKEVSAPPLSLMNPNYNLDTAVARLSREIGIDENFQERPSGLGTSASAEHASWFCLQYQTELATNEILFHRQAEEWRPQAIRDVLPFFLGGADDDALIKKEKIKALKKQIKEWESEIDLVLKGNQEADRQARRLYDELVASGLLVRADGEQSLGDVLQLVKTISDPTSEVVTTLPSVDMEIDKLQLEEQQIVEKFERTNQRILEMEAIRREENAYTQEAEKQYARLKCINIFEQTNDLSSKCPLCEHETTNLPTIKEMARSLASASGELETVRRLIPNADKVIAELKREADSLKKDWSLLRTARSRLEEENQELRRRKELASYQSFVRGRVSAFLEDYKPPASPGDLQRKIKSVQDELERLEAELVDAPTDRLESALAIVTAQISHYAKRWDLEHANDNVIVDLRKLTLKFQTKDGVLLFNSVGSAQNHVGYHIGLHLGMHDVFTRFVRPVPRFLFLDQPSTPFFSEDKVSQESTTDLADLVEEDEDRLFLTRLFQDLIAYADEQQNFQIIITEHANFAEDWFQACVRDRWRRGKGLIPQEWIVKDNLV